MSRLHYESITSCKNEILRTSTGLDYSQFEGGSLAFDYEGLMKSVGLTLQEIARVQQDSGVGDTPLLELTRLTELVRSHAPSGMGARIFIKDEAVNPSGSFKDRRASLSAHAAKQAGYPGLVAATSGNYGAAVAAQAARLGLRSIIVQEMYDSHDRAQPEILEKGRKCEALGAEVLRATVGPELFYLLLATLQETGYFNASLYTPFSIAGIETLGFEIAEQVRCRTGRDPYAVLATHAGGGMVTGTARGLHAAGATDVRIIGVSVDLAGLHMASDRDFNRKSFTTGHTGFSVPFTTWPDRVDVPRNAARSLRYLDDLLTVSQGEVFFATELLARAEGLERGPAGNTSLAAALVLAAQLPREEIIVVTETEYTGAGKSPSAQLEFAARMGVEVVNGGPEDSGRPGEKIVIPTRLEDLRVRRVPLDGLRRAYLLRARESGFYDAELDVAFLAAETRTTPDFVRDVMSSDG